MFCGNVKGNYFPKKMLTYENGMKRQRNIYFMDNSRSKTNKRIHVQTRIQKL